MHINAAKIPRSPGIYRFYNADKKIIYIGKAKNLRSRVSSYFRSGADLAPAKIQMVNEVRDFDFIIVNTETEALLLEAGLIKQHQPLYNVVLKDDRNWTYIVITSEAFPRIITVHGRKNIRGKYFGPYTSGTAARSIVRLIHQILPLRTCKRDLEKIPNGRVCMQYHIGKCLGPCEGKLGTDEYLALVRQAERILRGEGSGIVTDLQKKMRAASAAKQYEKAAVYRDKIWAWNKVFQPQDVIGSPRTNQDIIGAVSVGTTTAITIMHVRNGEIKDKLNATVDNRLGLSEAEVLSTFIAQFYALPSIRPAELILPHAIPAALTRTLEPMSVIVPQRGRKRKLLQLAYQNAQLHYQRSQDLTAIPPVLNELQKALALPELPLRIECYDISNISGIYAVGAMVVMENGKLNPAEYRKFKIRAIKGPNDVMMMKQVLERRQRHPEWPEPQLIILDGGKPQLNTVYPILNSRLKERVAALAKREEELFVPGRAKSVRLPKTHPVSLLVQRLRNATHNQAIRYYRLLHQTNWKK